jgi:hypothetical protein
MSAWLREDVDWDREPSAPLRMGILLRDLQKSAYVIMARALFLLNSYKGAAEMCVEATKKFPEEKFFENTLPMLIQCLKKEKAVWDCQQSVDPERVPRDILRNGKVKMRPYPWMLADYVRRDEKLIEDLNEKLRIYGSKCVIKSTSLEEPVSPIVNAAKATPDIRGIFATRPILRGERIFIDRTATGTGNFKHPAYCENCFYPLPFNRFSTPCCNVVFCSLDCRELALANYHQTLCGKNFDWLYEMKGSNAPEMMPCVYLRILAMCVQQGNSHPLQHPAIARLTPCYSSNYPALWSFNGNIIQPIKILQALGVDVFTDLRYDTWVLQTIWWRMKNNMAGNNSDLSQSKGTTMYANPIYSFFNHSCFPNVGDRIYGTTIHAFACRDIRKGEELFVDYVEGITNQRAVALAQWLGKDCSCSKCKQER